MRAEILGLLLEAVFFAGPVSAYDAHDPNNCNGVEWDDNRALVVSKITAFPRVNFIKSPYEDDFKAAACPAATKGCQKKILFSYGRSRARGQNSRRFHLRRLPITAGEKPDWIRGWLPSTALTPIAPMTSPTTSDWIGTWSRPGGPIEIKSGDGGKLHVEGGMTLPTPSGDFQTATSKRRSAAQNTLAFTDEGAYGDGCHVRMQRIGPWLLVEDNGGCGGCRGHVHRALWPKN